MREQSLSRVLSKQLRDFLSMPLVGHKISGGSMKWIRSTNDLSDRSIRKGQIFYTARCSTFDREVETVSIDGGSWLVQHDDLNAITQKQSTLPEASHGTFLKML